MTLAMTVAVTLTLALEDFKSFNSIVRSKPLGKVKWDTFQEVKIHLSKIAGKQMNSLKKYANCKARKSIVPTGPPTALTLALTPALTLALTPATTLALTPATTQAMSFNSIAMSKPLGKVKWNTFQQVKMDNSQIARQQMHRLQINASCQARKSIVPTGPPTALTLAMTLAMTTTTTTKTTTTKTTTTMTTTVVTIKEIMTPVTLTMTTLSPGMKPATSGSQASPISAIATSQVMKLQILLQKILSNFGTKLMSIRMKSSLKVSGLRTNRTTSRNLG